MNGRNGRGKSRKWIWGLVVVAVLAGAGWLCELR